MRKLGKGVIARYGNWFHQDDDYFTHCLITKDGECWLLGQGLNEVFLRVFKAPAGKFKQLQKLLKSIPVGWAPSSYNGYNFITDAESPGATEIAVYGKKPGVQIGAYFVPPAGSQVEALVKAIAKID
jgi:hypothetical protein